MVLKNDIFETFSRHRISKTKYLYGFNLVILATAGKFNIAFESHENWKASISFLRFGKCSGEVVKLPGTMLHSSNLRRYTPPKTKMTMEKQPYEDVSPIKNCDLPFPRGSMYGKFSYIYRNDQLNAGNYSIHGWYGYSIYLPSCHRKSIVSSQHSFVSQHHPTWAPQFDRLWL